MAITIYPLVVPALGLLGLGVGQQTVTITDIVQALSDSDQAITNFSVTSELEILQKSGASAHYVPVRLVAAYTIDQLGRVSYEAMGEQVFDGPKPSVVPLRVLAGYDGEKLKVMWGSDRYASARVSRRSADLMWRIDPREFIGSYFHKPVHQLLQETDAQVIGATTWNGRTVAVVEGRVFELEGGEQRKYQFWIDYQQNFTVVRRAAMTRFGANADWQDYSRIETSGYHEAQAGVWLPANVLYESFDVPPSGHPELSWRFRIKNRDWVVNALVPDETFEIEFLPGLFVVDEIAGRNYQVAGITDKTLAEQTRQMLRIQAGGVGRTIARPVLRDALAGMRPADEILSEQPSRSGSRAWPWIAFIAVAAVASVTCCIIIARRRRKIVG